MRASPRKSLADRAKKKEFGAGCLRLFFLPFFLVGAAMFYGFTLRPALQILESRNWTKAACVIDSSQVESHPGDDGATYSIDIRYHYFFENRNYSAKQYQFLSALATSGFASKQAVVDRYPAGAETFCYINPRAPGEAVIDRSWRWELLIFGGFALVFLVVGGLGIFFGGGLASKKKKPLATPDFADGPAVLRPKHTPLAKFFGLLAFAVVWNGFMGIFAYFVFFSEDHAAPIFVKILVGIFVAVGVLIIFGVVRSFLALFSPRILVTAQTTNVALGGEFQFSWAVSGHGTALRKLRIIFEGREEATYRRGTSTSTDTRVFAELPVFETSEREFLSQGSARVAVPPGVMHTFEASNNKVLWRLRVRGEIPRWPDVDDEYPITVLPQPASS